MCSLSGRIVYRNTKYLISCVGSDTRNTHNCCPDRDREGGRRIKMRKMHVKSGAQVLSSARHTTPLPSASKPHVHAPFL